MLVLSRKKNKEIIINNDIVLTIVEIRGDKVRIGIEAPKEVPVHRREVFEAIRRDQPVLPQRSSPPPAAVSQTLLAKAPETSADALPPSIANPKSPQT